MAAGAGGAGVASTGDGAACSEGSTSGVRPGDSRPTTDAGRAASAMLSSSAWQERALRLEARLVESDGDGERSGETAASCCWASSDLSPSTGASADGAAGDGVRLCGSGIPSGGVGAQEGSCGSGGLGGWGWGCRAGGQRTGRPASWAPSKQVRPSTSTSLGCAPRPPSFGSRYKADPEGALEEGLLPTTDCDFVKREGVLQATEGGGQAGDALVRSAIARRLRNTDTCARSSAVHAPIRRQRPWAGPSCSVERSISEAQSTREREREGGGRTRGSAREPTALLAS